MNNIFSIKSSLPPELTNWRKPCTVHIMTPYHGMPGIACWMNIDLDTPITILLLVSDPHLHPLQLRSGLLARDGSVSVSTEDCDAYGCRYGCRCRQVCSALGKMCEPILCIKSECRCRRNMKITYGLVHTLLSDYKHTTWYTSPPALTHSFDFCWARQRTLHSSRSCIRVLSSPVPNVPYSTPTMSYLNAHFSTTIGVMGRP